MKIRAALVKLFNIPANLSTVWAIAAVLLLSFAVKLGYIATFGGGLSAFPTEGSDVYTYHRTARVLLESGVYGSDPGHPTTDMPPGESVFLALLYAFSNGSIVFAKLAHTLLLSLVAVLTYLTGRELFGATTGFWAGGLIAIDPAYVYLSGTFLSEPLFIFSMVLGIYFLLRGRSNAKGGFWLIGAGFCFAIAGLTRNQGWLFSIALWMGAVVTRGRRLRIYAATIVLLVTVATTAPWTYRNYRLTGHFVPVSSEGGLTLWGSNNPEFVWRPPMPMSRPIYEAPAGLSGPELDRYYRERALQWIVSHPIDFLINGFRKVIALYHFDPMSWRPEAAGFYRIVGLFPYGVLIPFILLGLTRNLGNPEVWPISWYVLFTTLISVLFFGDSRIRTTIQPYLYLFGTLGVQTSVRWVRAWNGWTSAMVDTVQGQS